MKSHFAAIFLVSLALPPGAGAQVGLPPSDSAAPGAARADAEIADFIDAFNVRAAYTPGMDFNELTRGDIDYFKSGFTAMLGQIEAPGDITWLPGLIYEYSSIDLDATSFAGMPAAPRFDDGLHLVSLPNFLIRDDPRSRWFQLFFVNPGIQSDFHHVDSRDFRLAAAVAAGYRVNDCLTLGFGIYGSDLTNDPFVMGAPGFLWRPTDDWLVTYFGPKFIASRSFGDHIRFGADAEWHGGNWSVETFNRSQRLHLDSIRAGLFYKHEIASDLWLEFGLGYTFANSLELVSEGGRDLYPAALGEMDSAPYARVMLSVHRW